MLTVVTQCHGVLTTQPSKEYNVTVLPPANTSPREKVKTGFFSLFRTLHKFYG
jgi:hypothetical protein